MSSLLMEFFDKGGNKISKQKFSELATDSQYTRVGEEALPDGTIVSTIWIGFAQNLNAGKPDIFETVVINSSSDMLEVRRYATEEAALAGHAQAVGAWKVIVEG